MRSYHFDVTIGQAYATLGLDASSATPDAARLRFRDLIRSNHPDGRPTHEQALANEKTRAIIEACAILRMNGFLSSASSSRKTDVDRLRSQRTAASDREPADPLEWFDEIVREWVRGDLAGFAAPLIGAEIIWRAWATGWAFVYGQRRK